MFFKRELWRLCAGMLFTACLLHAGAAIAAESSTAAIGEVIHLMGLVEAEKDDGTVRKLELSSPIFAMETIVTGRTGNVEIRFTDDTIYSQGTDSKITLDEYVYSDDASASSLAFKMTQGTFRFVTGKIVQQNPEAFALKTPLSTIGIRGTEPFAIIEQEEEQIGVIAMDPAHSVVVTSPRGTVVMPNAGLMTRVKPEESPTPPAPIPADVRESVLKSAPMTSQGEPGVYGSRTDLKKKVEGFENLLDREKEGIGGLKERPNYRQLRTISLQEKSLDNARDERDGKVDPSSSLGGSNDDGQAESSGPSESETGPDGQAGP